MLILNEIVCLKTSISNVLFRHIVYMSYDKRWDGIKPIPITVVSAENDSNNLPFKTIAVLNVLRVIVLQLMSTDQILSVKNRYGHAFVTKKVCK